MTTYSKKPIIFIKYGPPAVGKGCRADTIIKKILSMRDGKTKNIKLDPMIINTNVNVEKNNDFKKETMKIFNKMKQNFRDDLSNKNKINQYLGQPNNSNNPKTRYEIIENLYRSIKKKYSTDQDSLIIDKIKKNEDFIFETTGVTGDWGLEWLYGLLHKFSNTKYKIVFLVVYRDFDSTFNAYVNRAIQKAKTQEFFRIYSSKENLKKQWESSYTSIYKNLPVDYNNDKKRFNIHLFFLLNTKDKNKFKFFYNTFVLENLSSPPKIYRCGTYNKEKSLCNNPTNNNTKKPRQYAKIIEKEKDISEIIC